MNWKILLLIAGLLLLAAVIFYLARRRKEFGRFIHKLPLRELGYPNIPAMPFQLNEIPGTLVRLSLRSNAVTQAKWGMSNVYQIGDYRANGYTFQYGRGNAIPVEEEADRQALRADLESSSEPVELTPAKFRSRLNDYQHPVTAAVADPITLLSLTEPEQFALSWTTFNGVYDRAKELLPEMAGTMTDVAIANRAFWPTIANHCFAYNLLILVKADKEKGADYKRALGAAWTPELEKLLADQLLYAIDLRSFASLPVSTVKDDPRFTPATLTLLAQDADKSLRPVAILVMNPDRHDATVYSFGVCGNGTWLYALMAAKTSVTLYGIWIGHVYHWHIVSAALVMTLNNHVEETHPLRIFMAPQSRFLIPFNDTLLLLWKRIAPPTSLSTAPQFLELMDAFANGRSFLQDDPTSTLQNNGIREDDFSHKASWDQYRIAGQLLSVFDAVGEYVTAFVNQTWQSDAAVVADKQVQAWVAASSDPADGNVAGIPTPDSRKNLITILQSLVFRLTAHGVSRLNETANPVLSFVPNSPPCLQRTDIPLPTTDLSTADLLTYLPKTGTIGEMITFLFIFVFSAPYVPFLPIAGNDTELIWGNDPEEPRNAALIGFREFIEGFIRAYESPGPAQLYQWPRNIET